MSKNSDPTLAAILLRLRSQYLDDCQEGGGTAEGLRQYVLSIRKKDPQQFEARAIEALMEATTKAWQASPRKEGDDLFSINGITLPEFFTRPQNDYASGEEIEADDEHKFEKVSCNYATISDMMEDATIKMRKAAQASAAAERKWRLVDEAKKRAKGNMQVFVRDVSD